MRPLRALRLHGKKPPAYWSASQWPASTRYFSTTLNAEADRLDTTWHAYASCLKGVDSLFSTTSGPMAGPDSR